MENDQTRDFSLQDIREQIIKANKEEALNEIRSALLSKEDRGAEEEELISLADAALGHMKSKRSLRVLTIVCYTLAAVIAAFVIYVLAT